MTLRPLLSLLIALTLALTSQSMAVARGASAAAGQMVICTGTGPQAVYVDAEGQPTSAPHICPDAALELPAEARTFRPLQSVQMIWPITPLSEPLPLSFFLPDVRPPSRAPPVSV
ncbi:MAG: hypothetical protein HKN30_01095 [Sulfitobacter sp.]|nr:hypothetical protein [Sulfitobacter sp.]